ncbi:MAG0770 family lipoprotein, partial [Mycoplasmopsis bovis]|uniref:MAG0770 family lipoprotein n=1 Tax=Mycoplasmopsis bovis TaxID=28903 RepID=UPI003D28ADFF
VFNIITYNVVNFLIKNGNITNIISDYVKDLKESKSDSLFKSFYNEFDFLPGWPLFKNLKSKERHRYQSLFLDSLSKKYSGMQSEYSRKFFDSQKVNIDYKNIRGI